MVGSRARCDWGHAWPSRSRTQGADFAGCKGKPEDAEMRSARRVVQVCLVGKPTVLGPQGAGDHHLLDLVGALADREDLRVAVEAADRVLLDVAVAAVDLDGLLAAADREAAALQLRLGGGEAEVFAPILHPRRFVDE